MSLDVLGVLFEFFGGVCTNIIQTYVDIIWQSEGDTPRVIEVSLVATDDVACVHCEMV